MLARYVVGTTFSLAVQNIWQVSSKQAITAAVNCHLQCRRGVKRHGLTNWTFISPILKYHGTVPNLFLVYFWIFLPLRSWKCQRGGLWWRPNPLSISAKRRLDRGRRRAASSPSSLPVSPRGGGGGGSKRIKFHLSDGKRARGEERDRGDELSRPSLGLEASKIQEESPHSQARISQPSVRGDGVHFLTLKNLPPSLSLGRRKI